MRDPQTKILSCDEAAAWREQLRHNNQTLVMTNGCFDLPHPGHAAYLNQARQEGDALLVAINSDESLRKLKGPDRPVVPESGRAYMLASFAAVDAVVIYSTRDCVGLLEQLRPDVYVKGGDYSEETINQDERVVLNRLGCRLAFLTFVPAYSSSKLLAQLKKISELS